MNKKEKDDQAALMMLEAMVKEADAKLMKDMLKLMNRIERIFVPSDSVTYNPVVEKLADMLKIVQQGKYLEDVSTFSRANILNVLSKNSEMVLRKVNWKAFEEDLHGIVSQGNAEFVLPSEVYSEIEFEVRVHEEKLVKATKKERLRQLQYRNNQPIFPFKWRKEPFPAREYSKLTEYEVSDAVSSSSEIEDLLKQLDTPLDGYLGQAYNYDDHGLTEEWMLSFRDKKTSGPSDEEIVRTQLSSLLEIMIAQVQDRVLTETKVLSKEPLQLGVDVKEIPVWGIDCYTRAMIELAIKDRVPAELATGTAMKQFVELVLLPSINSQDPAVAHDVKVSLLSIIAADVSVDRRNTVFAQAVLDALEEFGNDPFRIHPKGTGVICIRPEGIPAHVLVAQYLGEIYPPHRWCERLDVIEQAQKQFELKPTLPDFYNILLERPRQDPRGYGLLYVDASQKANIGSSCSHSCDSNCTSAVVARNGKLSIVLTTNRHIHAGEELTMDYYSITTSDVEWRAAICLCGMSSCRGSFLHFATQDDLQQVLNQNFGPGLRYASLLRACSDLPFTDKDAETLSRHGIQSVALGNQPASWVRKYVTDILRFIEFERMALPCALLRAQTGQCSFATADMDARCVMEQRIQSMVCCVSMVNRVLDHQPRQSRGTNYPLKSFSVTEAVKLVWDKLQRIPKLIDQHFLKALPLPTEDAAIKVEAVKSQIQSMLRKSAPAGFNGMRESCLEIRKLLLSVESLSSAKARLGQLADVLLLWAFTTNFSRPHVYETVESGPIVVSARELGTNIPRAKLLKSLSNDDSSNYKPLRSRGSSDKSTVQGTTAFTGPVEDADSLPGSSSGVDVLDMDTTVESIDSPGQVTEESAAELPVVNPDDNESTVTDAASEDVVGNAEEGSANSSTLKDTKPKLSSMLSPNEPIFTGKKTYAPLFCFWQLIGWFNAGTDEKVDKPDLFGCVLLPSMESCFGPSEMIYGPQQRKQLVKLLRDEKLQAMAWPPSLRNSFNLTALSKEDNILYGSPMLDTALGQADAVQKVLKHLAGSMFGAMDGMAKSTPGGKFSVAEFKKVKSKQVSNNDDDMQLDNILPPEKPTSWVQCEGCKKWRRVPWHVDAESLSEDWVCTMNSWDPENANCSAAQDGYDPATENTVEYSGGAKTEAALSLDDFVVGTWRDVYCVKNKVYYEAQVKKVKPETGKIRFHYRGWSEKFDEWLPFDTDRIVPHHLFTNPDVTDPRAQEIWQGKDPIERVVVTAFVQPKKRKSEPSDEAEAATKTTRRGSKA